jgi:hypothetical protein
MQRLADIAAVNSGYHFRGKIENDPAGRVAVIQMKDFTPDHHLIVGGLVRVKLDTDPTPYSARAGDVLFLSRGQIPWAAAIGEPTIEAVVPSYFYIVRVDAERVRPDYVAWFINHPTTRAAIKASLARGTNLAFVPKRDFEDLAMPVPPLSIQDKIVALNRCEEHEQRLLSLLAEHRRTLVDALCMKLARNNGAKQPNRPDRE